MRFEARKLIVIGGTRGMGGAIAEVAAPRVRIRSSSAATPPNWPMPVSTSPATATL